MESSFDFYDDWEEEEDMLGSWTGNDEFDRLLSSNQGYGTVQNAQPGRPRGMSYPKGRRKSLHDGETDPTVIPGSSNFISRLFGRKGKILQYKPSAADLQEHPGARRLGRDLTEGEALLADEGVEGSRKKKHRRIRSNTVTSGHTTDSLSSRGDIFPSDEELDDAIPLDDEFAMVLERRTTHSGPETESSSQRTRESSERHKRRGKRPSAGSRASTHSSRSRRRRSRANSSAAQTPIDEHPPDDAFEPSADEDVEPPTLSELKVEDTQLAEAEESEVRRKREEAQKAAVERGLLELEELDAGEATNETPPHAKSPVLQPVERTDEPSQLPTPLGTDDEEEGTPPGDVTKDGLEQSDSTEPS